jgi:phytoene synthase
MTSDTYKKTYATLAELEEYIYGSAEVIGLVMAKLMNLPAESYATARLLGKGFQYINFIRDIAEDIQLGRQYIPLEVLRPFGFEKLTETTAREKPDQFKALIKQELSRYRAWQTDGEAGFSYIPKRALLPIKTAADMYRFTADVIEKDPFVIFRKKVKPTKLKIIWQLFLNLL